MRKIAGWITRDGTVFTDYREASKHAEETYGELVLELAKEVARIGKYSEAIDWIQNNTQRFVELAARETDLMIENEEDGE